MKAVLAAPATLAVMLSGCSGPSPSPPAVGQTSVKIDVSVFTNKFLQDVRVEVLAENEGTMYDPRLVSSGAAP